jgi:hypothetical protein
VISGKSTKCRLLINGDHAGLIKEPVLIGGSIAATGALMLYFRRKAHVIDNRKWRLIVIDDSE